MDEDATILTHGDQFEVIGTSYVAIYDSKKLIPPIIICQNVVQTVLNWKIPSD